MAKDDDRQEELGKEKQRRLVTERSARDDEAPATRRDLKKLRSELMRKLDEIMTMIRQLD